MAMSNGRGPTSRRKDYVIIVLMLNFFSSATLAEMDSSSSTAALDIERECSKPSDCTFSDWTNPLPECNNWKCQCTNGTCAHYTDDTGEQGITYYCGECGTIGSECDSDNKTCQYPGLCLYGFCQCQTGDPVSGLCVQYRPVSTSQRTIMLTGLLILMLIVNKLISAHKAIRRGCCGPISTRCICCRCSRCCARNDDSDSESYHGYNPVSGTKSAAYTISGGEFIATSNDPDLDWALELSRQLVDTQSINEGASTSELRPQNEQHGVPTEDEGPMQDISVRRQNAQATTTIRVRKRTSSISSAYSSASSNLRSESDSSFDHETSEYSSALSTPVIKKRRVRSHFSRTRSKSCLSKELTEVNSVREEMIINSILSGSYISFTPRSSAASASTSHTESFSSSTSGYSYFVSSRYSCTPGNHSDSLNVNINSLAIHDNTHIPRTQLETFNNRSGTTYNNRKSANELNINNVIASFEAIQETCL